MKIAKLLLLLDLVLLLYGCNRQMVTQQKYLALYQTGQLGYAEKIFDETMPEDNFLSSNDAVMLLLDRATVRFAGGDTRGAIHDYQCAIEAIDYYSQASPSEVLAQVALQDDIGAYAARTLSKCLREFILQWPFCKITTKAMPMPC